jgi:hypothetical protein
MKKTGIAGLGIRSYGSLGVRGDNTLLNVPDGAVVSFRRLLRWRHEIYIARPTPDRPQRYPPAFPSSLLGSP